MSSRVVGFVVLLVFALVACGPSSAQLHTARHARYRISAAEAFQAAVATVDASEFALQVADPIAARASTVTRWYQPSGKFTRTYEGQGAPLAYSFSLTIEVAVVPDGDAVRVELVPVVFQAKAGLALRRLPPDDPEMPHWVGGKVDNLYLALHERLRANVVAAPR